MAEVEEKIVTKEEEDAEAEVLIWKYVFGFIEAAVVKCAIELGIADAIDTHGQPMSLPELSDALGCSFGYLHRVMRFLAHQKIFKEIFTSDGTKTYALTSLSRLFTKRDKRSLRDLILFENSTPLFEAYNYLSGVVRENGTAPFAAAHGEDIWGYVTRHPQYIEVLNDAMACDARIAVPAMIDGCAIFFEGVNTIVDVGGGSGSMSRALIKTFPSVKCINFDLSHVLFGAPEINGVVHVGGDMFEAVPKADVVVIKSVLHDWGDDECVHILKNCREAVLDGSNGKVIIVEVVINQEEDYKFKQVSLMLDMAMMAHTTHGKERTREEWGSILNKVGFSQFTVKPIKAIPSVIIAYP